MEILNQIAEFVSNNLPAAATGVAVALELAMRLLKTEKPKSLLLLVKGFLDIGAAAVVKIGQILSGLSSFLDKVVPQNLK